MLLSEGLRLLNIDLTTQEIIGQTLQDLHRVWAVTLLLKLDRDSELPGVLKACPLQKNVANPFVSRTRMRCHLGLAANQTLTMVLLLLLRSADSKILPKIHHTKRAYLREDQKLIRGRITMRDLLIARGRGRGREKGKEINSV